MVLTYTVTNSIANILVNAIYLNEVGVPILNL